MLTNEIIRDRVIDYLSRNLKNLRLKLCFSQDDLSNMIGVSRATLSEIENGKKTASLSTAMLLYLIFKDLDEVNDYIETEMRRLDEIDVKLPVDDIVIKNYIGHSFYLPLRYYPTVSLEFNNDTSIINFFDKHFENKGLIVPHINNGSGISNIERFSCLNAGLKIKIRLTYSKKIIYTLYFQNKILGSFIQNQDNSNNWFLYNLIKDKIGYLELVGSKSKAIINFNLVEIDNKLQEDIKEPVLDRVTDIFKSYSSANKRSTKADICPLCANQSLYEFAIQEKFYIDIKKCTECKEIFTEGE